MHIINLNRAELAAHMAMTVRPTCVNMPEELIEYMPSYMRDRVSFVNCDESICVITLSKFQKLERILKPKLKPEDKS